MSYQPHSPKITENVGLGTVKPKSLKALKDEADSSSKETKSETESKIDELAKLVHMLVEDKLKQTESPKSSKTSVTQTASPSTSQEVSSSKGSKSKSTKKPQSKCDLCNYTNHSTDDCYRILFCLICKREDHRTSEHEKYIQSPNRLEYYNAQPHQYPSHSQQAKFTPRSKVYPPCTHCGYTDHEAKDCYYNPKCNTCGELQCNHQPVCKTCGGDHETAQHRQLIRPRFQARMSQGKNSQNESGCKTCGSSLHSTSDHNELELFKRGSKV